MSVGPFSAPQLSAQETEVLYLSGTDKDHTVDWDFLCTGGRNSDVWTKIPVPSNWELQGFGSYNYGHDKPKADEKGLYKYRFTGPGRLARQARLHRLRRVDDRHRSLDQRETGRARFTRAVSTASSTT